MATGLTYEYTDSGYCRVYYSWLNSKEQKVIYCAQDEGQGAVRFYRCTDGDWKEPEYQVFPKDAPPFSPNDTSTDKVINEWIAKKWEIE